MNNNNEQAITLSPKIRSLLSSLPEECSFFCLDLIKQGMKDSTVISYLSDLKMLYDHFDKKNLTHLTKEDILSAIRFDKTSGCSYSTIRRRTYSYKKFYAYLNSADLLDYDLPPDGFKSPKYKRSISPALTDKELKELTDGINKNNLMLIYNGNSNMYTVSINEETKIQREITKSRNILICLLLSHLGLKTSEICMLDLEDVDLSKKVITVGRGTNIERVLDFSSDRELIEAFGAYLTVPNTDEWFIKKYGLPSYDILVYIKDNIFTCDIKKAAKRDMPHLLNGTAIEVNEELLNDIDSLTCMMRTRGRISIGPASGETALFITLKGGRKKGRGSRMSVRSVMNMVRTMIFTYVPECRESILTGPSRFRRLFTTNLIKSGIGNEEVKAATGSSKNTIYQLRKDIEKEG